MALRRTLGMFTLTLHLLSDNNSRVSFYKLHVTWDINRLYLVHKDTSSLLRHVFKSC